MRERELERIMRDFYHQRFNILVCTTIVESGIDVPTANTIIIDRADKLGLRCFFVIESPKELELLIDRLDAASSNGEAPGAEELGTVAPSEITELEDPKAEGANSVTAMGQALPSSARNGRQ